MTKARDQKDAMESTVLSKLTIGGVNELTSLFMHQRAGLRRLISMRLDPRLHARVDASDIVQEAFVRACKALPSYLESPVIHPVVWLRLIGKRLVAEVHRRHFRDKRSPEHELGYDIEGNSHLINQFADSIQSAGSVAEKHELILRLRDLLQSMPVHDREILEMRHVDGISLQEAAQQLSIPYETAKKRYQRALQRFRDVTNQQISAARQQQPTLP